MSHNNEWAQLKQKRQVQQTPMTLDKSRRSSTPVIHSTASETMPATMTSTAQEKEVALKMDSHDLLEEKQVVNVNSKEGESLEAFPVGLISIKITKKRGRGVFADTKLPSGSTLIETKPFIAILNNSNLTTRCSTCFVNELEMNVKQSLLQCSLCHTIKYCSKTCQKSDWKDHKLECSALKSWRTKSRVASSSSTVALGELSEIPDTRIRALARVIWKFEKDGDKAVKEFASLYSGDPSTTKMTEENASLLMSLSEYVTPSTMKTYVPSVEAWKKIFAQYELNSFALTTPYLDTVGVTLSTPIALFNHSCRPNVVVVFPSLPSTTNPNYMRVVVIRPVEKEEELVINYLDPLLPREKRLKELRERYGFDCDCGECVDEVVEVEVDVRERIYCGAGNKVKCGGRVQVLADSRSVQKEYYCTKCYPQSPPLNNSTDLDKSISKIETILQQQSSSTTSSDETKEEIIELLELAASLTRSLRPTSYPIPSLLQYLLIRLLDHTMFIEALAVADQLFKALDEVFENQKRRGEGQICRGGVEDSVDSTTITKSSSPNVISNSSPSSSYPHPIKAIVLAAIVKLRVASRDEGDLEKYWLSPSGLTETLNWCRKAVEEVELSFGKGSKLGKEMRAFEKTTEQSYEMMKRFGS